MKEEAEGEVVHPKNGKGTSGSRLPEMLDDKEENLEDRNALDASEITDDELRDYFVSLNAWLSNTKFGMNVLTWPNSVRNPTTQIRQGDFQGQTIRLFYECELASLWKRFVAEFIDGFILFLIKFYLIIILHDGFNLTLDHYISYLENPTLFFSFTTEIAAVEFISRLLIFSYESYFLYIDGATPGKKIMGLKVYTVESICPIPGRTTVSAWPCKPLGWWRALFRSILKNIGLFVFPVCYGFMITNYSRAGYDHVLNTFVIDTSKYPVRLLTEEPGNVLNRLNQQRF